jgi:hypothetical protein
MGKYKPTSPVSWSGAIALRCTKNPGFDVDLSARCDIKTMTEIWIGRIDLVYSTN